MSTLVQIESAVAKLPPQEQRSLLAWLQERLGAAPGSPAATPEALQVFRQLQEQMRLTTESAATWKETVADARR